MEYLMKTDYSEWRQGRKQRCGGLHSSYIHEANAGLAPPPVRPVWPWPYQFWGEKNTITLTSDRNWILLVVHPAKLIQFGIAGILTFKCVATSNISPQFTMKVWAYKVTTRGPTFSVFSPVLVLSCVDIQGLDQHMWNQRIGVMATKPKC